MGGDRARDGEIDRGEVSENERARDRERERERERKRKKCLTHLVDFMT